MQLAFNDGSIHVWRFGLDSAKDGNALVNQETITIPAALSDSFSPDGKVIAGTGGSNNSGNAIKLWEAATGRELLTLNGHTSWVMGLAFSPDGKWLASTSLDGTVKIWNLLPGNEMVTVFSPVAGFG